MAVLSGIAQASTFYEELGNVNVVASPDGTLTVTSTVVAGTPISHGTTDGQGFTFPSPLPGCFETDQTDVGYDADNPGSTITTHLVGPVCSSGNPPTVHGSGTFTITGGTGKYAGATGGGTVTYDGASSTTVLQGTIVLPLPTSKDQCKDGGWQNYDGFKNQGDCVSFVATDGTNPPG